LGDHLILTLGGWTAEALDELIRASSVMADAGERIAFLSGKFIGTPYRESTLFGDATIPEVLVVNLEGLDCFTFIDYVEAMRLSGSCRDFSEKLKRVRYRFGEVAFSRRNHFFSDWRQYNREFVLDVTEVIGGTGAEKTRKILNRKEDGTEFIKGLPSVERAITYIPSKAVDRAVLGMLKTGDYVGMYSTLPGLDVSHVGIVIREGERISLRHASATFRCVIDEDFAAYIAGRPGVMVLRPQGSCLSFPF
jgi:cell wall-associated NlpC family hydrolase